MIDLQETCDRDSHLILFKIIQLCPSTIYSEQILQHLPKHLKSLLCYPKSLICVLNRSSRTKVFCKKSVHRNFLFFDKVTGLRLATLLKRENLAQVFSCESCEISRNTFSNRTPFLTEHLPWLLLIKSCSG